MISKLKLPFLAIVFCFGLTLINFSANAKECKCKNTYSRQTRYYKYKIHVFRNDTGEGCESACKSHGGWTGVSSN